MSLEGYKDFSSLVSPERVHKACYSDEGVFEQELNKNFCIKMIGVCVQLKRNIFQLL